jgi:hypothetical protein
MALSMFQKARSEDKATTKTWRAVVIGAAVPIAMLAGAPAVSAAETTEQTQTVQSEQLPPLPVDPPAGLPDPAALLDLEACLTELQGLIAQLPPAEVPAEAEQLPPVVPDPGVPAVPDVSALTETCKQVVEIVKSLLPPVDVPVDPPIDDPGLPVDPPVDAPVPAPGLP